MPVKKVTKKAKKKVKVNSPTKKKAVAKKLIKEKTKWRKATQKSIEEVAAPALSAEELDINARALQVRNQIQNLLAVMSSKEILELTHPSQQTQVIVSDIDSLIDSAKRKYGFLRNTCECNNCTRVRG
jgi:hypothetical protein